MKDVRSREGGGEVVQCGHFANKRGGRGSSDARLHILLKKHRIFQHLL